MSVSLSVQCGMLGYNLHYWQTDVMGKKHRYCTSNARIGEGIISGGGISYFDTAKQLQKWINDVNFIRECYDDDTITLVTAYQEKHEYTVP